MFSGPSLRPIELLVHPSYRPKTQILPLNFQSTQSGLGYKVAIFAPAYMHFLPHENEESLKRSFKPDTFSTPFKPAYESNSRHLNSQSNDSWQNPLEKTREPKKKKKRMIFSLKLTSKLSPSSNNVCSTARITKTWVSALCCS